MKSSVKMTKIVKLKIKNKVVSKNWVEIMENEEKENQFDNLNKKLIEHENKLLTIKNIFKIDKRSYTLRFEFSTSSIIWCVSSQYMEKDYFKFSLNPVRDNLEVYQYFYYDYNNSLIGVSLKNDIRWYKINYVPKLIQYTDSKGAIIYFSCSMIDCQLALAGTCLRVSWNFENVRKGNFFGKGKIIVK